MYVISWFWHFFKSLSLLVNKTYPEFVTYMNTEVISLFHDKSGLEALIIEAKSRSCFTSSMGGLCMSSLYTWLMIDYLSWPVKFVPGNFNLLFGVRIIVHSSLKSTKSNSRGHYGRRKCYVMKFCLTSGQHWVFGVVNNYSAISHVTEVLDNTKRNRTNDVVTLLTLWVCS